MKFELLLYEFVFITVSLKRAHWRKSSSHRSQNDAVTLNSLGVNQMLGKRDKKQHSTV